MNRILRVVTMSNLPRLMAFQILVILCIAAYLYKRVTPSVALTSYYVNGSRGAVDHGFWKRFGIESECRRFIRADEGGVVLDDVQAYRSNLLITHKFTEQELDTRPFQLNINKSDVIVVVHIQKTGGTAFENHLVLDTIVDPPCNCTTMPGQMKRLLCTCVNDKGQDWMFNRHTTGWTCGVHSDLTETGACVDLWFGSQVRENRTRRYHYVTMLRDPVTRFISEWLHVRRGATWKEARLSCNGRDATLKEVPFCFKYGTWVNVSLSEFMNCSSNMAFNRMTRMLSNLSLVDCYRLDSKLSQEERNEIMLQSAKDNLTKFFKFFGLVEYQEEGQLLLEKTILGLKFKNQITSKKSSIATNYAMLSEHHWSTIVQKNLLDVRLYQFAKDLFLQRLKKYDIKINPRQNEALRVERGFTYTTIGA
ncbi:heparan-sulfate 6-O-sulfotransferase 3-B-like [Physella acuta]|uniref:heparan-sulfate 6-O-sulfotransferase 3-B-like n=1 Tax=Physella acuta TaxID=109671 RepID=UPI0027DAFD0B|nr:heparan-sulfate 6-O-sulfotransferase 3-B-like [Physella acuta]